MRISGTWHDEPDHNVLVSLNLEAASMHFGIH